MIVMAPISLGELIDKITILEIKQQKFKTPAKLENVKNELAQLQVILASVVEAEAVQSWKHKLKTINEILWIAEDRIRSSSKDVKQHLAMSTVIRRFNENRALVKKQINNEFGSAISEEKEYAK